MLNVIIVEDEKHCQDRLAHLLRKHRSSIALLAIVSTVSDAKAAIEKYGPDVVFLDIQLHDRTGFELLQEIPNANFEVVFTTAFDQYALKAFRFSALDYLLKPIAEEEVRAAIEKLQRKISLQEISKKLEVLFHNLKKPSIPDFQKIAVPSIDGLSMILISDIIRCQSDINYTHLFLRGGKKLTVAKTLKHFESLLKKHHFHRPHQSHLINMAYVDKYIKGKGGYVLMDDGSHIPVFVNGTP